MLFRLIKCGIFLSVYSCDIPGTITIKNVSEGDAIYRYEVVSSEDSTEVYTIEIPNDKGSDEAGIIYGFGQFWTDERIKEYVQKISFIEIISQQDSIRLTDKEQMFEYFRERRGGLFKNKVKIKIE